MFLVLTDAIVDKLWQRHLGVPLRKLIPVGCR
jgi:hypothetical protein